MKKIIIMDLIGAKVCYVIKKMYNYWDQENSLFRSRNTTFVCQIILYGYTYSCLIIYTSFKIFHIHFRQL